MGVFRRTFDVLAMLSFWSIFVTLITSVMCEPNISNWQFASCFAFIVWTVPGLTKDIAKETG